MIKIYEEIRHAYVSKNFVFIFEKVYKLITKNNKLKILINSYTFVVNVNCICFDFSIIDDNQIFYSQFQYFLILSYQFLSLLLKIKTIVGTYA